MLEKHFLSCNSPAMELRVLNYFLAVAREGSITRAANTLHLTQPTLTRQIHELEEELGQKLLVRGKYRMLLTPEGVVLRKRAEEIFDLVAKTEAEFRAIGDSVSGDVYLGCGESDVMKYIAGVMQTVREQYPQIRFHIYSGNAADVMERLDSGFLDFGILIQPVDISRYHHMELPEKDRWGVIMRTDCALARKKYVVLSDLYGLPLIHSRQAIGRHSVPNDFLRWFGNEFEKMNTVATFNLVYNAAVMVRAGLGYAVSLDKLVSEDSELCFRPLMPRLESSLDMVWQKERVFSAAAGIFLEKVREKLESRAESGEDAEP